jgi:ABC-2 type transport system ATP-binding protein
MIETRSLTKVFRGQTVLKGVSLQVDDGEIFGFLGPNGAGKTTTVRLLLGLLNPTSGEALVWGQRLGERPDLRRRVGVVLETDGLYERLSARDNLRYFARLYLVPDNRAEAERLLRFVGLSERAADKVGTFSKGMRRKLALARAILGDPQVLFLDEPAAGLDPAAQHMVRELILQLSRERGISIFLNSHDLDEVERICTSVAILQKGEVKAYDRVSNLRRASRPVMELTLSDAAEAARTAGFLGGQGFTAASLPAANRLTVTLPGESDAAGLLRLLVGHGFAVEEAQRVTRSLEDVYLETVRAGPGA